MTVARVTEKGLSLKSFFAAVRKVMWRGRGHDILGAGIVRENPIEGGGRC